MEGGVGCGGGGGGGGGGGAMKRGGVGGGGGGGVGVYLSLRTMLGKRWPRLYFVCCALLVSLINQTSGSVFRIDVRESVENY